MDINLNKTVTSQIKQRGDCALSKMLLKRHIKCGCSRLIKIPCSLSQITIARAVGKIPEDFYLVTKHSLGRFEVLN